MKILFSLAAFLGALSLSAQQTGKIEGVVTYFFNKYQGDKPDLGAQVVVIDSAHARLFDNKVIDTFNLATGYRALLKKFSPEDLVKFGNIPQTLEKLGADTPEKYDQLASRALRCYFDIDMNKDAQKTVVDGTGKYSFTVAPGKYFILIKSKGRIGLTPVEVTGRVVAAAKNVKANETVNFSHNFTLE